AGPCVRYGNLREAINPRGADAHPAPGGGDRRHGVHRVHHQVDDDLLKLNTVTVDRQRLSGRKAVELDGPCVREAFEQCGRLCDEVVDVEIAELERRLLQQASQALDHLAGAVVVAMNIQNDLPDFIQVRRRRLQYQLRRLGVCQDRSERLVELV